MTGETGDDPVPKMEYPQIFVERTLAIIKPDAVPKAEEIEDIILRSGFSILQVCHSQSTGSHIEIKYFRLDLSFSL